MNNHYINSLITRFTEEYDILSARAIRTEIDKDSALKTAHDNLIKEQTLYRGLSFDADGDIPEKYDIINRECDSMSVCATSDINVAKVYASGDKEDAVFGNIITYIAPPEAIIIHFGLFKDMDGINSDRYDETEVVIDASLCRLKHFEEL